MEYLKIRNWAKYQHYNNRNPPWIKLHSCVLDDYKYGCLQDDSKLLLITLFLLASRTDNKIPNDPNWIKQKGMLNKKPDCNLLVKLGFLEIINDDSTVIASCKQNGGTEKRREETETEKSKSRYNECVFLTKDEYSKLTTQFGSKGTENRIQKLNDYIMSKGKKYKSHYHTILTWERLDRKGGNGNAGPTTKYITEVIEERGF